MLPRPLYFIALIILMLLLHELHEWAHHIAGFMLCGCWGARDFVYWTVCASCDQEKVFPFVSLAGPFLSYLFMWTSFFLMNKKRTPQQNKLGYSLVFACLPFPKLVALYSHGGDEIAAMRNLFHGHSTGVIMGALIVLIFTLPPIWKAFTLYKNKFAWLIALALFLLPVFIDRLIVEELLNHSSIRIWMWDVFLLIAFLPLRKYLTKL